MNEWNNYYQYMRLASILNATTIQMVTVSGGVNYAVRIVLSETLCNKTQPLHTLTDCPFSPRLNMDLVCDIVVNGQECCNNQTKTKRRTNTRSGSGSGRSMKMRIVSYKCTTDHSLNSTLERHKRLADILGTSEDDTQYHQFAMFLATYDKAYPSQQEYNKRFRIFRANMNKVKYLQQMEQGTAQYGATQFADLTATEFKKYYLGLKVNMAKDKHWTTTHARPRAGAGAEVGVGTTPNITLPQHYDWRDFGAVTPVKNQGLCGSCWAFSVTGNMEGQYAIKNNKLLSFSEQELVDCDKYDDGCRGGEFDSAFHAIKDLGGLETESDYPYEGYNDKCKFKQSKVRVKINSWVNISSDETDMAKWLVKHGPISVALNANAMQFYFGGVSHPLKLLCSPSNLDHGVLIVGYGVHSYPVFNKTMPYWIIKNSWGHSWGLEGYYWLYRGDGSCGVNKMPTSALL